MSNISQHQAAEIWEVARDHCVMAAKINWMCREVQDGQLRSQLEQHARRCQQIGQQLMSAFQQNGYYGSGGGFQQSQAGFQNQFSSAQFGSSTHGASFGQGYNQQGYQGFQSGANAIDVLAVGECLKDCKGMAVRAMIAATESSQPIRNTLYQIAGEHLQMAEQHYHWLEQRQLYASPKADQQATQQYQQALQQIAQAGQGLLRQPQYQEQQTGSYQSYQQNQHQNQPQNQQHQYQQSQQPAYSTAQYATSSSQNFRQ